MIGMRSPRRTWIAFVVFTLVVGGLATDSKSLAEAASGTDTITTFAGTTYGFSGDGGQATAAQLRSPRGMAIDGAGNVLIADSFNNCVRKVDTSGVITTFAGTCWEGGGSFSGDGGLATAALLAYPFDLDLDTSGNVYIADAGNQRIRKVDTSGVITTFAGTTYGFSGDGGPATAAQFASPYGVAVDTVGNVYIADQENQRIRIVDTSGVITTLAGTTYGFSGDGGPATAAQLRYPFDVDVDGSGNVYIADSYNHRIRKVDTSGVITTIAGTGSFSTFGFPYGVAVDTAGNVYIVDEWNDRIRKLDTSGTLTTLAGTTAGFSGDGGPADQAQLWEPWSVAVDSAGNVYIADARNSRIRKVGGGIGPSPQPPQAAFDVDCAGAESSSGSLDIGFGYVPRGETVTCDLISTSADADGTIVSWLWTDSGLPIASGPSASVAFASGNHNLKLTVVDDDGLSDSAIGAVVLRDLDVDWRMEPRFGADVDEDGLIDYRTTPEEVAAPAGGWQVGLIATKPDGSCYSGISTYTWTTQIDSIEVEIELADCDDAAVVYPREDVYGTTLSILLTDGDIQTFNLQVVVQDWLIVSIGDSVASGEGNPDIQRVTETRIVGSPRNPVPVVVELSPESWQDRRCHRSAIAGPAQAAMRLEEIDPRTSVTFVHLACSGAKIRDGLLGEFEGREPGPEGDVPPQMSEIARLVGGREIDALLLSVGANDIRFGKIFRDCIRQTDCNLDKKLVKKLDKDIERLPDDYALLATCLQGGPGICYQSDSGSAITGLTLDPSRVMITEYFDPTRGDDGDYCLIIGGSPRFGIGQITEDESEWASTVVVEQLNEKVAKAAEDHGWSYVGGVRTAFWNFGYCGTANRWIVQLSDSLNEQGDYFGTLHPNDRGQAWYQFRLRIRLIDELYVDGDLSMPRPPG